MIRPPAAPRGPDDRALVAVLPEIVGAAPSARLLFGATASTAPASSPVAGRVQPVPVVTIGGATVAAGPAPDGTWPDLMVVEGLSVRWGRDEVLAQPDPATARVTLFDTTAVWAAAADLIGRPISLWWQLPDAAAAPREYFTGRVAALDITPHTVTRPDGTKVRGALVALSCTSLLADLGNRQPTGTSWLEETLGARRVRLQSEAAGVVQSVTCRDEWTPAPLATVKVDDADVLSLLQLLYNTCGADRMVYDPATRALDFIRRRHFTGDRGLAHLFWNPDLRTGVFIQALAISQDDGEISAPLFIDAHAVEYAQGIGKDMGSRLTRAAVGFFDGAAAYEARTITEPIPGADEALVGERTATMPTHHSDVDWATTTAVELASFAANEGSGWRLEPLRWDTARTGGFETLDQAELLLSGVERFSMYFLQGSWLPSLGIRPVFGVIGGTIEYRRGGWAVEWHNAPVATDAAQPPELTWDHVDAGDPYTVVWDEDDNPFGMHASVTWEDLQYVALGLGVTDLPTDGA